MARSSWWARLNPDQWFVPPIGTVFKCVRDILLPLDTPREELEADGAIFVDDALVRYFTAEDAANDRPVQPVDVRDIDKYFTRCAAPHRTSRRMIPPRWRARS